MNQYNKPGHYAQRPMEIELIRSMSQAALPAKPGKTPATLPDPPPDPGEAFIMKPAADWLQMGNEQQHDEMLFGEFWHEGELCILFADTNVGKSILAVQIGNSISRGEPMPGFPTKQQPKIFCILILNSAPNSSKNGTPAPCTATTALHPTFSAWYLTQPLTAYTNLPAMPII
jgi:hypothetical protein